MITLPPPLQEGVYTARNVSARQAGDLIAAAAENGQLVSRVTFAETAATLTQLAGVIVSFSKTQQPLPSVRPGDMLLQAKLRDARLARPGAPVPITNLEFLLIEYGAG